MKNIKFLLISFLILTLSNNYFLKKKTYKKIETKQIFYDTEKKYNFLDVKNYIKYTFKLNKNKNPYSVNKKEEVKFKKIKSNIHVYMIAKRSKCFPEIINIKRKNKIYLHITNLEQNFNIPHGFIIKKILYSAILIMPGQTKTIILDNNKTNKKYLFVCTDIEHSVQEKTNQYIFIEKNHNYKLII
jgi:nitrous-oxide reductase